MSLPPLCKALALFNLLDDLDAPESGVPLQTVRRHWAKTGLRIGDLDEVLSAADATGDFELVTNGGETHVRASGFEDQRLNPATLPEIEALSRAFRTLRSINQRQPAGNAFGRRMQDSR